MAWVVEMTGYDGVAGTEKTVRFAMGEGIAFSDVYAAGALTLWTSPSQRLEVGAEGVTRIQGDKGRIEIANHPDTILEAGPLDAQGAWIWQNRTARLYWVDGENWASRILTAQGVLEQPIAGIHGADSKLSFELRDPRSALETPLQPATYAGTNVGSVGLEGSADLTGRPKPIVYGLVSNVSPPLVNESLLIYQIADKSVKVICVRDGAISLTAGTIRGTLASLVGSVPISGRYDLYRGAEGTFIRLGSSTIFNLTVDADEAAIEPDQSHARIWSRIRTERTGATVDATSVVEAHTADLAGAGFYWDTEKTQKDALDEVLGSFSGYELQAMSGEWKVGKLVEPSGTPTINLVTMGPTSRMRASSRAMISVARVRPSYAPDGAPPYKVTVHWGRNYTVMGPNEFAGAADVRLKEKFGQEYRLASAVDNSIWNPAAGTGPWKNAPELVVKSGYQPSDGYISDGAQNEANRLLALLGPLKAHYQVEFLPKPGDVLENAMVFSMTYPRYDLESGALFRVLQARFTVEKNVARASIVLGLQG